MTLLPYHATPRYSVRPYNFRLAPDHPLSQGCVFAGMGAVSGSEKYVDSSGHVNNSSLENLAPGTAWGEALGRRRLKYSSATPAGHVLVNTVIPVNTDWSYSQWVKWVDPFASEYDFYGTSTEISTDGGNKRLLVVVPGVQWKTISLPDQLGGVWQHLVLMYRAGVWTAFLNGVEQATLSDPITGDLNLTRYGAPGFNAYDSSRADLAVYNRALSPTEIQTLANPGDPMLDDWVQPVNTTTYSFPIAAAPPAGIMTDIFESAIIGT